MNGRRRGRAVTLGLAGAFPLMAFAGVLALSPGTLVFRVPWGLMGLTVLAIVLFTEILPPLNTQVRPGDPSVTYSGLTATIYAAAWFGGPVVMLLGVVNAVLRIGASYFAWRRVDRPQAGALNRLAAFLREGGRSVDIRSYTPAKSIELTTANSVMVLISFPTGYLIARAIPVPAVLGPVFTTVLRLYVFGIIEAWVSAVLVSVRFLWKGRIKTVSLSDLIRTLGIQSWVLSLFAVAVLYAGVGLLGFAVAILTAAQAQVLIARAMASGRAAQTAMAEAEQAYYDGLTGVQNRRGLEREFGRGRGRYTHLSICDIDHFKIFNDTYGHQLGDDVLRRFAQVINTSVEGVYAGRYGGEEFVLMLSAGSDAEAEAVVDRIRQAVETDRYVKDAKTGGTLSITASFGLTRVFEEDDFEKAVKRADDCLYEAKEGGRNRVVLAA